MFQNILFPAITCTALVSSVVAAADQPNLIWLSCEDISPHLGCYGDPHARTPNLDQLASDAVLYSHAFVPAGVCAPCRSTIITGMYQTTIGTHHMRCSAKLPSHVRPFTTYLREAGYYCTNNSKKDYQFKEPKDTWDESSGKAHWRNRPDRNQPFFSVFNFTECHESGIADDAKYDRVTKGQPRQSGSALTTLPPYYPDTPAVRADWARYYDVITAMDRRVGELVSQLKEDGLYDNTIVVFWSDHGVGLPRAKRWLYDSGMRVPLIVRVPQRWQQFAPGEAGTVSDRLVSLMDLGPSMLKLAGINVPEHMQGVPFLGPDLPKPREYVYGARDRMDERYDIIRAVRNHRFKYIRNYEPFKPYYQYMNTPEKGRLMKEIRRVETTTERGELPPALALFLASSKPAEELYDTVADPHEVNNLAADPAFREKLERLREAHLRWVVETRDLGLIPEPEIARREKRFGSCYEILRQKGSKQTIGTIRDAATMSLDAKANLDALLELAGHRESAVRYWAAIGIGNAAASMGQREVERLHGMLGDSSPVVQVAAARALCRANRAQRALPVLRQVLEHGQQWERLHAIIVLDEIEELAQPLLPAMKRALRYRTDLVQNGKYTVRVANRAINELLGTKNEVR